MSNLGRAVGHEPFYGENESQREQDAKLLARVAVRLGWDDEPIDDYEIRFDASKANWGTK